MLKKIIFLSFLLITGAYAHEWYDSDCCSQADCRPVPCQEIKKAPGGYFYHSIFFSKIKSSQDMNCHACFYGTDPNNPAIVGRCLYLPGSS